VSAAPKPHGAESGFHFPAARETGPKPTADRSKLEGPCVITRNPSMRDRWIAATGEKIAHRNVRLVGW
jgi:hypothetical protein